MSWPGGRLLVAAVGVGVIVAGLTNAWHLIDGSWRRNIDLGRCPPKLRPTVTGFAVVGLLGRVFVFLARTYALQGNKKNALGALKRAVEKGLDSPVALQQNKDFDALRDEPEFKKLVESLGGRAP